MLLENKGLAIDDFFVPPFIINKGEIVTIYMFGGGHFFDLEKKLVDIFTGRTKSDHVDLSAQFHFIVSTQPFSDTANIIFDLIGQGANKAVQTYETVRQHVKNGGAAIFLDNFNDASLERTRHVEIKKLP